MSSKKSLEKASNEARRAAARAREFANLFDEYAVYLLREDSKDKASELRLRGKSKLAEVREAVSDSDDWARVWERELETRLFEIAPSAS
jgi:ElaB/YqjD/DUF883 family membrane-anchored ribosome-binding protein